MQVTIIQKFITFRLPHASYKKDPKVAVISESYIHNDMWMMEEETQLKISLFLAITGV
jgi:hypothetical protein